MRHFKWVVRFWRPYKLRALLIIALTFVYGGFAICYPLIFKYIIDSLNAGGAAEGAVTRFVAILFASGTLMAVTYMFLQRNRLLMNLTLERDIRNAVFERLTRFGHGFFQRFGTGDIVTRLMDELEQLCHLSSSGIFRLLQITLTITFTVVVLVMLNVKLTMLSTLPLLLVFAFYMVQDRDFFAKNKAMRDAVSAVNDAIETCFSGIQVVKSYCTEPHQERYFDRVMDRRKSCEIELIRLELRMDTIYGLMSQVGMFVVVFYGGFMVLNKEITLGTLVAFSNYIMVLAGPLMEIGWFLNSFRKGCVTVDRLFEIESSNPEVFEVEKPLEPDFEKHDGTPLIEFRNASFTYGDEFSLKDLELSIAGGEKIAFAGAFGSGKSTVLKLLMRFFDPAAGALRLASEDLRNLRLSSVRDHIGYVPQDSYLFSDTILENIAFGREYTKEELARALGTSQLNDALTTFRRGLDEEIGIRGLSLSGGQKQRVSIARALLKSPDILILDDATSSLDNRTEDVFWEDLKRNYPGTTVIFASHRLNTIKQADRVFVIDGGRIAASGTFSAMAEGSEVFRRIVMAEKNGDGDHKEE